MSGLALQMALRNWRRVLVAALALALALTLFVYYQVMVAGLTATVQATAARRLVPADILVYAADGLPANVLAQIRGNQSVASVALISERKLTADVGPVTLLQLDTTMAEFDLGGKVVQGRLPKSPGEVCVADCDATTLGLAIGSQIHVDGVDGTVYVVTGLLDATRPIPRPVNRDAIGLIMHQVDPEGASIALVNLSSTTFSQTYRLTRTWSEPLKSVGGYAAAPNADASNSKPSGLVESLVSGMSVFLVAAVGVFLGNLLLTNMLGRKKEYDALHVIGLLAEELVMFPLAEAILVALMAVPGLLVSWFLILPRVVPGGVIYRAALTPGLLGSASLLGVIVAAVTGTVVGVSIYRSRAV